MSEGSTNRALYCAAWVYVCLHGASPVLCAAQEPAEIRSSGNGSTQINPSSKPVSFRSVTTGVPPLSPEFFSPDPPVSAFPSLSLEKQFQLDISVSKTVQQPSSPAVFNPDPGQSVEVSSPFYNTNFGLFAPYTGDSVPQGLELPRNGPVFSKEFILLEKPVQPEVYGLEPIPNDLKLPRTNTVANKKIEHKFEVEEYPQAALGKGYQEGATPVTNRWRIGFAPWRRYTSGVAETPYETPDPKLWHPYKQSILKGDLPIIGQDIFLNLTASSQTEFESRRLPTPSGVSAARPNSAEFFGKSEQLVVQQNFSFLAELFKGETVFQPVHWAITFQPVFNVNFIDSKETGVVNPDPRGQNSNYGYPIYNGGVQNPGDVGGILNQGGLLGTPPSSFAGGAHTTRTRSEFALQNAAVEYHLTDLSVNYDFLAAKAGIQPFSSDFRGFIFNDSNLGIRLFGNANNNVYQYNLALFDMLEKDTFSDLNTFNRRDQQVIVANVYKQDFLWKGYTAQLSFHANIDEGRLHYDRIGNITRPTPIGTVQEHDVRAYYLGWAGDGHIGSFNVSHAIYEVLGRDDLNGIAGKAVDINAQMAALEVSYDRDWIRYKGSIFYASGDGNPEDGTARGFDSILDNANFTGGPFSYYVHQGFNLAGTAVGFKARNSLVTDFRSSKTEGQANFVNPGLLLFGVGTEMELTPKLRAFANMNYLRFMETETIKTLLVTDKIDNEIGLDLSIGFQYRPLLTDNIIISAGFGTLIPGKGYRDIYRRNTQAVAGYGSNQDGQTDSFLYSGILAITFTY
ncbi:MAG: hypothetical protein JWN25_1961 [Verrucomicrobiales bacterium]|nr:hypothetical protein [Verrucomicrobiales bacterium]